MRFEQRQGCTCISLHLRDDDFVYAFRRAGRQVTQTIPYHAWPFEGEPLRQRSAWLGWAGWLSTVIGLLVCGWTWSEEERLRGVAAPWLMLAFGLHLACAWTTHQFSRFMVGPFPILLLHDAQHDAIAAELSRRRTACLRRYLLDVQQPPLRPRVHQRRLDWLLGSGVITDAEYQQASQAVPAQSLAEARRA